MTTNGYRACRGLKPCVPRPQIDYTDNTRTHDSLSIFRLQAMRESYLEKGLEPPRVGPLKLTGQILKSDGVGGLFRGLTPTFMREMPGYFCFFYAYEMTREALKPEGGTKEDVGLMGTMFAGGLAGVTLWTVIFPADVIKSRLQVRDCISTRA
jgi:solute carrier family 25 ornithine transporter 2/15